MSVSLCLKDIAWVIFSKPGPRRKLRLFQNGTSVNFICVKEQASWVSRYTMNNVLLDVTDTVKYLGVWFSSDLKVYNQCSKAYSKANRILGVLKHTIENKNIDVTLSLYKTVVRPHVEYCTSAWSPYYWMTRNRLKKIQHRFTRMLPEVKCVSYNDRLLRLGLWSLEEPGRSNWSV